MTHSMPLATTHTNSTDKAVSLKMQAGSYKSDVQMKSKRKAKTFMQYYREYTQLVLARRLGDKRPSVNPLVIARYGRDKARMFEQYDRLNHQLKGCGIHQRINFRQQAVNTLQADWPEQALRLNKMWRAWQ
ncbi:hypothetical protein [Shewanella colwelliana]|uniref:hypothetical protein n=1 Tax=Shewanella colwelliana TaxID=23 RepID=UPI003735C57D